MLKKILLGLAGTLFSLMLFLFFITTVLTHALRPEHLKHWAASSGIYASATDNILDKAKTDQKNDPASSEDFSPSNPGVQAAAKQAFTPAFMQGSAEQVIDGSFHWLDGKTAQPDFTVDLRGAKQNFADGVASYALQRYNSLPACKPKTLPSTTDPLTVDCKPAASFDINAEIAKLKSKITTSKDFLSADVLSASTLKSNKNGVEQPLFDQHSQLPKNYRHVRQLPMVALLAALLLAIAMIFLGKTKVLGARKVSVSLLVSGVMAGVGLWGVTFALTKARTKITNDTQGIASFKDSLVNLVTAAQHDIVKIGAIIAGSYMVVGTGLLIGTYVLQRRAQPTVPRKDAPTDKPQVTHS